MSDPVTNVEIEDVLSSIRRLVSEGGKGAARDKPVQDNKGTDDVGTAAKPAAQPLVLTPSLRVAETPETSEMSEGQGSEEPCADTVAVAEADNVASLPRFLQRRRISFDLQDAGAPKDAEDVAETIDTEADPSSFGVFRQGGFESATPEETSSDSPRPWETDADVPLADWHAKGVDAVQDYEPDTAGDSEYAGTPVEALVWEDHDIEAEEQIAPEVEHPEGEGSADAAPEWDAQAGLTSQLEEVMDDHLDEVYETAAAPLVEPVMEQVQASQPDEAVMDEETLRELVGDIVRQELQSTLGERITRNVRKLVRREIHRALAARNIE